MRWEYQVLTDRGTGFYSRSRQEGELAGQIDEFALAEKLDALGDDGWELVSAVVTQHEGGTQEVVLILKRPKEDG